MDVFFFSIECGREENPPRANNRLEESEGPRYAEESTKGLEEKQFYEKHYRALCLCF